MVWNHTHSYKQLCSLCDGSASVARVCKMSTLLGICVCLAWYVYLVDMEMFISTRDSTLDQIILQRETANELLCFRLCKKTFGCNAFRFLESSGQCDLARGSILGSVSGFVYTRLCTQGSNASVTATPITSTPEITTPEATTPVS